MCCHFLIIKSDETATDVGANSGDYYILQDSGIFRHLLWSNHSLLEIGGRKHGMISDVCTGYLSGGLGFNSKERGGNGVT